MSYETRLRKLEDRATTFTFTFAIPDRSADGTLTVYVRANGHRIERDPDESEASFDARARKCLGPNLVLLASKTDLQL